MRFLLRQASSIWIIVAVCAVGLLGWVNAERVQRIETVSGFADGEALPLDPKSPTGYAGGVRRLIVPEIGSNSYQWIAQTQQMLARGEWRVRHIDYDNAPVGRDLRTASPYRWWLGWFAWADHQLSGRPLGVAVERAALWADPLLHALLIGVTAAFVAWRFGAWAAASIAAGLAGLFPFAGVFAAGLPNDRGLALGCTLWSVLLVLAGAAIASGAPDAARRRARWFFLAGVAGGLGLWLDVAGQWPVLLGLAAGGIAAGTFAGEGVATRGGPWRSWALGGAAATLAGYLLEYLPNAMGGLQINAIHPLFGLAWLGVGELLEDSPAAASRPARARNRRDWLRLTLAVAAVLLLPAIALLGGRPGLLGEGNFTAQLTQLGGGLAAENASAWFIRDGASGWFLATVSPLILLGPAIWLFWRTPRENPRRGALALTLGPVLAALLLAGFQLRWWATLDVTLLGLLVAGVATRGLEAVPAAQKIGWTVAWIVALIPGFIRLAPAARAEGGAFTVNEVTALVERDFAHWLATRIGPGGGIVLAPPALTTSLCFHGGLRGLGTPYPDNQDGFAAAVRIAGETSADGARALAARREVAYIVMPSWDNFLDEYARLGGGKPETTLIGLLHQWLPPRWLRPVAYQLPKIAGFERESLTVFAVGELQDNATALARLAGYFGEMGLLDQAAAADEALARLHPDDPGALLARAEVAMACGEPANFAAALELLEPRLAQGADQAWSWDRQVHLAIVLAEGKRYDAARTQVRRCLATIDESGLRSLSPVALYRWRVLLKAFGEKMADPHLHDLARTLLPAEMRDAD